ncbi:MAG: restriction endonuclease subunit S [Acidobacteriaceae bacterium]
MASEWRLAKLGDIIKIEHGWPFKSDLYSDDLTGKPIVVSIGNFNYTGGFRFGSTLSKEYRGEYPAQYDLNPGEILLVMTCQTAGGEILGIPARVPDDGRRYLHNQRLGKVVIKRPMEVIPDFLYFLFLTPAFNRELVNSATGTKILHTAPSRIETFQFRLPPPHEQHAIAHILGTLDDKIELNRKRNETLEAMARALFQSWFVDFDPVRAKAAVRREHPRWTDAEVCRAALPTLAPEIAAIFPDSYENSALGDIPKGWRVGSLSDVAFLNPESWSRTTKPEIIRYIDLANTKWGRIEAIAVYSKEDAPSRAQRVLRCGDTIVGTVRPGNGSYALIAEDGLTGSTGFAVLRPRKSECCEFTYLTATAQDNIESLAHLADGGAYPAVRPEVVIAKQIVMPPDAVIANFAKLTEPLISRLAQGERESNTLAALRDTLLPKLISGELRLKSVEHFIESVG